MKIMFNDECLVHLTDMQVKVLCDYVRKDDLEENIKHMASYFIKRQYDHAYKQLYDRWLPILAASGVKMIPTDPEEFAALVFAHPEYKCRITRDEHEQKLVEQARLQ